MIRISEKEHKHQVLFNSLIGIAILGLFLILQALPWEIVKGGAMGFDLLFSPLKYVGVVLLLASAVGLVLSYIIVGAPTENIWKESWVILPLGVLPGGLIGYLIGKVVFMMFGLLIGFCAGLIVILLVRSSKKKSLPQENIMNYFLSRMEEIKVGSYVPTYETFKKLSEFSEISEKTFLITREQFYSQYLHGSFLKYSKLYPIIKIKKYFSSRMEEIKEGTYVPTFETLKKLPEFSKISREKFRTAREKWYRQHFGISFFKHSKQLKNNGKNIST